jgi:hypothetical protein
MPSTVDRQVYKDTLRNQVERPTATNFELADFRAKSAEIFSELGEVSAFTDAANEAALNVSLDRAKQEGLKLEDIVQVLQEVRVHVSSQAHLEALRAHEEARSEASTNRNYWELVQLKYKDLKTVFGGGVADDVRERATAVQANNDMMRDLLAGAIEMAIMRKRLKHYEALGGTELKGVLDQYRSGHGKHGEVITGSQLLDVHNELGKKYDQAIDKIIEELHIVAGPGETIHLEGISPDPEIPDEATKQAYEHHFKFVLRTELIKLVDAEQLSALSSKEYNLIHGKSAWEKAWQIGKGVATSGTFWGVVTRAGTRVAIGGLLSAALVSGGPAIIGGVVVGAGAGALAGYARERVNAKDRLKRRKLEAALGAIDDQVAKPASVINQELNTAVATLQSVTTETDKVKNILAVFKVATEAEVRLRASHHDHQDYVSFGIENRFKAQQQLLDNLEKSLAAIQAVVEDLPKNARALVAIDMKKVNKESGLSVYRALEAFEDKVQEDEKRRQGRAAIVGALGGGLGSLVGHYLMEGFFGGAEAPAEQSASLGRKVLDVLVPKAEAAQTMSAEHLVNVDGKVSFIQLSDGTRYALAMDPQHHLSVNKFDRVGDHFISEGNINVPTNVDELHVVEQAGGAQLVDGHGNLIATLEQATPVTATVTNPAEGLFANPEASKLLDAMGLQPGEVQYDPVTKLFHIGDNALHDATGHTEYLGQTAGWRARRMEFLLQALQDPNHANDTPAMLLARAERATSNLLLGKGAMHGDAGKAYAEAFGKDSGFIQKNVMPWIDGTRAKVSDRWLRLVSELQKHPVAATANSGQLTVRAPDVQAVTGSAPIESAAGSAAQAGADAAAGRHAASVTESSFDVLMNRHVQEVGMLITSLLAVGTHVRGIEDLAHQPARRQEYSTTNDDEFHVKETKLGTPEDLAEKTRTEAAKKTWDEKSPRMIAEIDSFLRTTDMALVTTRVAIDAARTAALKGSLEPGHLDAVVAQADGFDLFNTHIAAAKALLVKEDSGIKYADVDASTGGKMAAWLKRQEVYSKFPGELQSTIDKKITNLVAAVTATRTDAIPAETRRDQLKALIDQFEIVQKVDQLVPRVINDVSWKTGLEDKAAQAVAEAEGAIAILVIDNYLGTNTELKEYIDAIFVAQDCINPANPTLPNDAKRSFLIKFATALATHADPTQALEAIQFLNTTDPVFGRKQKRRVTEVMNRLFSGVSDIFA